MTRLELQNLVSYWVDDLQKTYFTPDQINAFLNNALKEIQKKLLLSNQNWFTVIYETDTVALQDVYSLPPQFYKLRDLSYIQNPSVLTNQNAYPMDWVTVRQGSYLTTTGIPTCFFLKNNLLVVRPYPDSVYRIRMAYDYRVLDMANDYDTPGIPEEFQEAIAIYAAFDCLIKDKTDPGSLLAKKTYFDELFKQAAQERILSQSRSVHWDEEF